MSILGLLLAVVVFEGSVVGPDARPVANALVLVRPAGAAEGERAEAVRTDASGRFRMTFERAALRDLRVEAAGLAPAVLSRVGEGAPVKVVLRKGLALEGVVRDARTGQAVGGARVEAREEAADRFAALWHPAAGTVEARSDAKGRYRLEGLGDGLYSVSARSRENGRALRRSVVAPRSLDLSLMAGGAVAGVVSGPDRKPVEGAVVRIEPEAVRIGKRGRPLPGEVTDARGRFEMTGLDPGAYRLVAIHRDFAPATVSGLSVTADEESKASVVLERGAALSGRVLAAPDRPLAGRVWVQQLGDEPAPATVAELSKTRLGEDGRFRLSRLPRGSHVLAVMADGYPARRIEVRIDGADVDLGDVVLEPGLSIRGSVRDDRGWPVTGAQVTAFQWRSAEGVVRAESLPDGSFALPGLSPGQYHVTVSAPGFGGGAQDVAAGAEDVGLVLHLAGAVTGTVVDAAGRAVEVFALAARPASRPVGPPEVQSVADRGGRFRVGELAEATYVLQFSAPGRGSVTVLEVKVAAGQTTDIGTVRLAPTAALRGTVVDAHGAPVGGAVVWAQPPEALAFGLPVEEAVTDPAGRFELRGVTTGTVAVTARHPDYAEGTARVQVAAEPAASPLQIMLWRGGRLQGLVRTPSGAPPSMSFLRLEPLGPAGGVSIPTPEMVSTLRDGSFAFEHVAAGRSRIVLMTGRDGRFTRSEVKEIEVREGATTSLEFVTP
jgi:carboxypeptidase family protein